MKPKASMNEEEAWDLLSQVMAKCGAILVCRTCGRMCWILDLDGEPAASCPAGHVEVLR